MCSNVQYSYTADMKFQMHAEKILQTACDTHPMLREGNQYKTITLCSALNYYKQSVSRSYAQLPSND